MASCRPGGRSCVEVPAVVVVFLALSNGGYDQIARSTVGVAVWWTVLVGTALNFLLPPAAAAPGA